MSFSLRLSCPKCGAPFEVDEATSCVSCEHCASLLLIEAPERDEVFVAEGQVRSKDELLEIFVEYRVQAQRAEILHRHRDSEGNPPPEIFVASRLAAFERKLRETARLLAAREVFVPYWHLTGSIVQGILGRLSEDIKLTRVRSFAVEHTVPGYDPVRANWRDRGLRLDSTLVRPLSSELVAGKRQFLPRVELRERHHREIDKWLTRDLDRRVVAVMKHGAYLSPRRLLVYRPYWVAKLVTDTGPQWILFDGGFRTIAGYPSEPEAQALSSYREPDPLGASRAAYRRVLAVASRCPDCGAEQRFERGALASICPSCHLALRPEADGVKLLRYHHAGEPGLDADYLPFWRHDLRVELKDGTVATSLEDYARALFPKAPPGFAPCGRHLWTPAFRLLGTEAGDAAFKGIAEWIHAAAPQTREGKLPLGGRPRFASVTVSEQLARSLAPFVLLALHTKASAARLNTLLVRKGVVDARVRLAAPALVIVPFARDGETLTIEGTGIRIPDLLLRAGPELQALRATVHSALVAGEPPAR